MYTNYKFIEIYVNDSWSKLIIASVAAFDTKKQ